MSEIVDLSAERNRRAAPDGEHVRADEYGRKLFRFILSYDFDGGQYGADIWAYSAEDAAAKVSAMRASLRLDGQVFSTIPA